MIHPILSNILIISLSCSGIAILLLIVRKLIGKNTGSWWRSFIWVLLLIRLCIPFLIETPIGIINRDISEPTLPNIPIVEYNYIPEANYADTEIPEAGNESVIPQNTDNNIVNNPNSFSLVSIANEVYLFGVILAFLVLMLRIAILNYKVSKLKLCNDREVLWILNTVKERYGIRRNIMLVVEDENSVPALCGLIRPVIIIPKNTLYKVNPREIEYIFIHELTHYKRGDIAKLWLMELVTCIHWFNPILHIIKPVIVQDIELACDENVLTKIPNIQYSEYGKVLVNFSTKEKSKHPLVVTSNFAGKRGNKLKERLVMIKKFKRNQIVTIGIILVLALSVVLISCTTALSNKDMKFDNAEITVQYEGEIEVNLDDDIEQRFIDELDKAYIRKMEADSIDIDNNNGFKYVIYANDIRYELFRLDYWILDMYMTQTDEETGESKLYYFDSSTFCDLLDDIELSYIKEYEITRYDDMLLDLIHNLIDGERTIGNVVSNSDEWDFKDVNGQSRYSTKMYLYNHVGVIISLYLGDNNLDRNLDYSMDVLYISYDDYDQSGGELHNPTFEVIMSNIFDQASHANENTFNSNETIESIPRLDIINNLNLIELKQFSCGLAAARAENGLCGYVNQYGEWVVEPIYNVANDFSENVAVVGLASDSLVEALMAEIDELSEAEKQEYAYIQDADTWGYVDINGNVVVDVVYTQVSKFQNGYGFIWDNNNRFGAYIDSNYEYVLTTDQLSIELKDYWIGDGVAPDGTIVVRKDFDNNGDYLYYNSIIDIESNLLLDGEKLNISSLRQAINGYRVAETNDKKDGSTDTGVINGNGEWIIQPVYDEVKFINENEMILTKVNDNGVGLESGIYDINSGTWIMEPAGKYIQHYGYDMIVFYTMSNPQKMELYSENGNILLNGKSYMFIEILGKDLVKTKESDSTPYMLTWSDGTRFINENGVDNAQYIEEDIIAVYTLDYDTRTYYIGLMDYNSRDEWLLEPKYNRLLSFDGNIGEGIIIDKDKSDSNREKVRKIVFYVEKFDLAGNVLSTSEEMILDYDAFNEFCPFFLR